MLAVKIYWFYSSCFGKASNILLADSTFLFSSSFITFPSLSTMLRLVKAASLIGITIGFYDGFFGPGTGSFFVFLFVRLLGYDFLNASASAKLLNVSTNIAALILFSLKGHIWWHFALPLALANVLGSVLGTHMALKHGTGFVRGIFILVVSVLILKTGYDGFVR